MLLIAPTTRPGTLPLARGDSEARIRSAIRSSVIPTLRRRNRPQLGNFSRTPSVQSEISWKRCAGPDEHAARIHAWATLLVRERHHRRVLARAVFVRREGRSPTLSRLWRRVRRRLVRTAGRSPSSRPMSWSIAPPARRARALRRGTRRTPRAARRPSRRVESTLCEKRKNLEGLRAGSPVVNELPSRAVPRTWSPSPTTAACTRCSVRPHRHGLQQHQARTF